MVRLDSAPFKELARKYAARAEQVRSNAFGQYRQEIHGAIKHEFLETLYAGERMPLEMQHKMWLSEAKGPYHNDGSPDARINPQELINASPSTVEAIRKKYARYGVQIHAPGGIHGSGRFYEGSFVTNYLGADGINFDLQTHAEMQPYPNIKRGYNQPQKPIMYYFRNGWTDPDRPEHSMKERPIGQWLAARALVSRLMARFNNKLLRAAGFIWR